jgi:sec-independent protein translocase protein TatC
MYSSTMLYYAVKFIADMNASFGVANYWDIGRYISQVIMASVFFGIVFEFPIVLTFLIRMGILKLDYLKRNRKYAIIAIFLFVGLLPPPEVITTFIQAFPLILLYEITIFFNTIIYRKKVIIANFEEEEKISIDA